MSKKSYYTECPRCGAHSFEQLRDYAHCPNCLYVEDRFENIETCYHKVRQIENELVEKFLANKSEVVKQKAS